MHLFTVFVAFTMFYFFWLVRSVDNDIPQTKLSTHFQTVSRIPPGKRTHWQIEILTNKETWCLFSYFIFIINYMCSMIARMNLNIQRQIMYVKFMVKCFQFASLCISFGCLTKKKNISEIWMSLRKPVTNNQNIHLHIVT